MRISPFLKKEVFYYVKNSLIGRAGNEEIFNKLFLNISNEKHKKNIYNVNIRKVNNVLY